MPKTVILGTARTPIGKMGGGLSTLDATELGGIAIAAALERAGVAPEQVAARRHGPGPPGRPGPDPLAPGADQGRHPEGGLLARPSTRSAPRACAPSVLLDQAIRAGDVEVGVGGGMESMSQAPYLLPERALRLPHGRRQGARRDGPRRPDQPVQRQADVRRGDRGRRRARAHPPRPGPLGAALARARDRRRPTRAACPRRSSPVTIKGRKGDTVVEVDEAPRRDTHARDAREAARPGRQGRHAHGRQLAGRQRRRRRARARLRRVGGGQRQGGARRDRRPRAVGQRLRLPRHARPASAAQEGAREGRPDRRRHRPVGDQRGVRLGRRSTRSGCSASTRTRSTSTAARSRSATRSAPRARASSATLVHELRRRGGGLGCAAICSGGGQGDAIIITRAGILTRDVAQRSRAAGDDGGGVLRPRPHADGGLVRLLLGARGARSRAWSRRRRMAPLRLARTCSFRLRARPTQAHRRACAREVGEHDLAASARSTCSAWRRRCSPACCRASTRRCSRSPTPTRTPGARSTSARPPRRRWPSMLAPRARASTARSARARRSSTGATPAAPTGPFTYREGKAQAMRELAGGRGHRPRPPPTPTRTRSPTCRCCAPSAIRSPSTRTPSCARVAARGGLGGHALRAARPAHARAGALGMGVVGTAGARGRRAAAAPPAAPRRGGAPAMSLHELTDEQREIRDLARRFADEEIAPHAAAWDREHRFPQEVLGAARRARAAWACACPQEHGGAGADFLSYVLVLEELSRADAGLGVTVRRAHERRHAAARSRTARPSRSQRLVPPLAQGHELGGLRADRGRARAATPGRCARARSPTRTARIG